MSIFKPTVKCTNNIPVELVLITGSNLSFFGYVLDMSFFIVHGIMLKKEVSFWHEKG